MIFVMTRTSDSTPRIISFNTIQDLIKLHEQENHGILLLHNYWYDKSVEDCMNYCEVSEDVAKQIVSTKYEIEIYDDYRE